MKMKKIVLSFVYSIMIFLLSLFIVFVSGEKIIHFALFIVFNFMLPQSYMYFFSQMILQNAQNDYATVLWLIIPYFFAPFGFVMFFKTNFKSKD